MIIYNDAMLSLYIMLVINRAINHIEVTQMLVIRNPREIK